ncbi:hypothetical protein PENTCL1PPCAC_13183, partial [Pristionchus entomophagus]
ALESSGILRVVSPTIVPAQLLQNSDVSLGEECGPGKANVMCVHENMLSEHIRVARVIVLSSDISADFPIDNEEGSTLSILEVRIQLTHLSVIEWNGESVLRFLMQSLSSLCIFLVLLLHFISLILLSSLLFYFLFLFFVLLLIRRTHGCIILFILLI